ncbi:hypothetical protein HN592_05355 [Candidatus Woesearchaeota archaeon]|jgi:hypothetical protein|nr:hypothetical protein [Candidatus Woesearchaeota archaeon]MBT4367813.1 hypothetical protein [Candidatus Woesearchaeota archaeon]MBT4712301.1 hypothetical protein [Candidatus Woesearchaeota archaeon]MBT6638849.1 hypothetical protein [Candidatus Woesearchaeota archaeon]MBT7134493.1 hypothetical protein [Candidatus Woesearchaeota archaeon]
MSYARQRRIPYQGPRSIAVALPSELGIVYGMMDNASTNLRLLRDTLSMALDLVSGEIYGMAKTKGKSGGKSRTRKAKTKKDDSKKRKTLPPQKFLPKR